MHYHSYTTEALEEMNISKGDLITMMGLEKWDIEYDTALPQDWLDDFVRTTGLPYNLVLSTTVWVYIPKHAFGFPVSGCIEVATKLPAPPEFMRINNLDA